MGVSKKSFESGQMRARCTAARMGPPQYICVSAFTSSAADAEPAPGGSVEVIATASARPEWRVWSTPA